MKPGPAAKAVDAENAIAATKMKAFMAFLHFGVLGLPFDQTIGIVGQICILASATEYVPLRYGASTAAKIGNNLGSERHASAPLTMQTQYCDAFEQHLTVHR